MGGSFAPHYQGRRAAGPIRERGVRDGGAGPLGRPTDVSHRLSGHILPNHRPRPILVVGGLRNWGRLILLEATLSFPGPFGNPPRPTPAWGQHVCPTPANYMKPSLVGRCCFPPACFISLIVHGGANFLGDSPARQAGTPTLRGRA